VDKSATPWKLNSFLDSLILELDKAQDTLALKGINRRLTYTVKDVSLELQLFPDFNGREIRFTTARPGESGAAKIAFQLGSITDRQIREVAKDPITRDDVVIEHIEGIDEETKSELQKLGINSATDLERMERKNIDLEKASERRVDYRKLANVINQVRRRQSPPSVAKASLSLGAGAPVLSITGENLALAASTEDFPIAFLNEDRVSVVTATNNELQFAVRSDQVHAGANQLKIMLDPYAVLSMELRA
jgi:hypothetical protein